MEAYLNSCGMAALTQGTSLRPSTMTFGEINLEEVSAGLSEKTNYFTLGPIRVRAFAAQQKAKSPLSLLRNNATATSLRFPPNLSILCQGLLSRVTRYPRAASVLSPSSSWINGYLCPTDPLGN